MVILQKEDRNRAKVVPVNRDDLRSGGRLHRRFVVRAEHGGREVEVRLPPELAQLSGILTTPDMQIPVDVIAVGNDRIGFE